MKITGIKLLQMCMCGYAFFMPVGIAGAEPFAFAAVAVWIYLLARGQISAGPRSPFAWPVVLFLVAAFLATLMGVRPGTSLPKMSRFLLIGVVFILPSMAPTAAELIKLVRLFVAGAVVKGLSDLYRVPAAVLGGASLFQTANMREPQIYAVALCFVFAALALSIATWRDRPIMLALLTAGGGLLLHFKRGAWAAFLVVACLMAFMAGRRRAIFIVLLAAACLLALPPVRERIGMTRQEFSYAYKGRYPIWTLVAPRMIKAHPFGMGWKAPQYEDLHAASHLVQFKLNHLHNNALEITLELGFVGLAAWTYWMLVSLVVMVRNYFRIRSSDKNLAAISLGVVGGFVALMLNGIVEYNFGDAEIFMVMCFLMAIAAAVHRQVDAAPASPT